MMGLLKPFRENRKIYGFTEGPFHIQSRISCNGPFAANDHVVQNPPWWRARSLLFPHWDIKTKASQASLVQVSSNPHKNIVTDSVNLTKSRSQTHCHKVNVTQLFFLKTCPKKCQRCRFSSTKPLRLRAK